MATGPGDEPAVAGRDRLRAGHTDREQVIEALKDAFVQGRLTRDELGARAGRALAARTYADLAVLTADIPPGPAVAESARRPARARRRPLARATAGSAGCLGIAFAAMQVARLADPGNTTGSIPGFWAKPSFLVAIAAVVAAVCFLAIGVAASVEQRHSRGQLPPRPGPGGHALDRERRGGPGHGPVPPGPGAGQTRADLRAPKSPRGIKPARGAPGIPAPVPRAT